MKITIYGHPLCSFCHDAKALAEEKNFEYDWIDISKNPEKYEEAKAKTGHETVPIVFADEEFVGGFTEFHEQVESGKITV